MIYYKYLSLNDYGDDKAEMDSRALNSIRDNSLYFARWSEFNDIGEGCFKINQDTNGNLNRGEIYNKIIDHKHSLSVLCSTISPVNAAMWALYGNAHNGICIGFKVIDRKQIQTVKIKYMESPPIINVNRIGSDEKLYLKWAKNILSRKSKDFKFEQEYRHLICEEPQCVNVEIREIYFGWKVRQDIIDEVKYITKNKCLSLNYLAKNRGKYDYTITSKQS